VCLSFTEWPTTAECLRTWPSLLSTPWSQRRTRYQPNLTLKRHDVFTFFQCKRGIIVLRFSRRDFAVINFSVVQLHFLAPSTCLYFYWTSNQPPFYCANSRRLNRYDVCTVYVLLLSDKAIKTFVAFVFIWQFFFKCRLAIEENIVRECAFYEF